MVNRVRHEIAFNWIDMKLVASLGSKFEDQGLKALAQSLRKEVHDLGSFNRIARQGSQQVPSRRPDEAVLQ
jgi:hypothetical protein